MGVAGSRSSTKSPRSDRALGDVDDFFVRVTLKPQFGLRDAGTGEVTTVTRLPPSVKVAWDGAKVSSKFVRAVRESVDTHGSAYETSFSHHFRCATLTPIEGTRLAFVAEFRRGPPRVRARAIVRAKTPVDPAAFTHGDVASSIREALEVHGTAGDPLFEKRHGKGSYEVYFPPENVTVVGATKASSK